MRRYLDILSVQLPLFWGTPLEEPYKREAATFDIPFLSSIAPIRWSRENYLLLDRQERTVSAGEAMAMAQEQLAALEERTFAGMEVLQREVSGQELPDRFRLEGVYLCVEDIGEEREILTGEEIPGLEPPAGAVKGAE